jgi:outer membrane protein assembly factor BamB
MLNTHIFYFKQLSRVIRNLNLLYLVLIVALITSCTKDDPKSDENKITTFQLNIDNTIYNGQINQETGKISFFLENDIPSNLVASISYSEFATITPSENLEQDFNKVIRYTVTAENGLQKTYTVIVNQHFDEAGNIEPGSMELLDSSFEGREVVIDWTDAKDSDDVIYKVFKNSIEMGEYLISEARVPFTYNQVEKFEIYAIDKKGGNSKLEFDLETPKSELIFIRNFEGVLLCIDTKVQDILWVKGTRDRFYAPAIVNNQVLYGDGNNLVGLNLLDGSEQGDVYERKNEYYPTEFLYDENSLYVKDYVEMYSFDINTRDIIWSNYRSRSDVPSAIGDDLIFTTSSLDRRLHALDKLTGEIVWEFSPLYGEFAGRPLVIENDLIIAYSNGTIYSVSQGTGEMNWEIIGGSGPRSFIQYGSNIIVIENDTFFALDITTGDEIWRESTLGYIVGSPFIHNGKLLVGKAGNGNGKFYAIDPNNGAIIWERQISGAVSSSPVAFDNKVYFGDQDGYLYCYDVNDGSQQWRITIGAYITNSPTFVRGNSEVIVYPTLLGFN